MGLIQSYVRPVGGFQSDTYVDVPTGALAATVVASTLGGANVAHLQRFRVARSITISKLGVYIGATSAGNVDAGIYTSDGTTWTRIAANGGTPAGTASTMQELSLTATVTLVPGIDYWAAFVGSDGTLTVGRVNASLGNWSGHGNRVISKASSYPLPSTITSPAKAAHVVAMLLVV